MITLSYTSSPFLLKELQAIEEIRNNMLLTLVSPREDIRLRWEVLIERLVTSLKIEGMYVKYDEVGRILTSPGKTGKRKSEVYTIAYKKAHDYIRYQWVFNTDIVSFSDFLTLYQFFDGRPPISQKDVKEALSFLQVSSEHPIIQAGIAYILFYYILQESDYARVVSLLMAYLFLYKNGFEFHGLLNLENYFFEHAKAFSEIIESSYARKNISGYLDHFILAFSTAAEKSRMRIQHKEFRMNYPKAFFELTERQRQILTFVDEPGSKVTNRTVQKHFRVSQITASRDLARLASLGLLFAAGKGRSVYYTKA